MALTSRMNDDAEVAADRAGGDGDAGGAGKVVLAAPEGAVAAADLVDPAAAAGQVAAVALEAPGAVAAAVGVEAPAATTTTSQSLASGQRLTGRLCLTSLLASRQWRIAVLPALLVALALALTVPRVTTPPVYVFDELYYAYTAGRLVAGDDVYSTRIPPQDDPAIEWTHPPLAKLLIAGGIVVGGDNPLGWRLASLVFGTLGVALTYFLALAITGQPTTSAVAALLLQLDGLFHVESRIGMSNLMLMVFSIGALFGLWGVMSAPPDRAKRPLLATGAFLGLALATKWSAAALAGLIGLAVCWRMLQLWRMTGGSDADRSAQAQTGLATFRTWAPLALVLLPAAIYLASYLHFFLTGHGWGDLIALHRDMLAYHRDLGVVHSDSSPWWQWPLAARPVWYFVAERRQEGAYIFGNGNPLLYWPMIVALAWVAIDWWGRRSAALVILLIGFFGQWLPWALSPRGTFVYHFLPAVPLGCLALAIVLSDAWRQGRWRRGLAVTYGLAVAATFAYFFPLYSAMPIPVDHLDRWLWFASWR